MNKGLLTALLTLLIFSGLTAIFIAPQWIKTHQPQARPPKPARPVPPPKPLDRPPAPPPAPIPQEESLPPDLLLDDPSLQNIVREIQAKLDLVHSCRWRVEGSEEMERKGKHFRLAFTQEAQFRRPDCFAGRMTQLEHVFPGLAGSVTEDHSDGQVRWQYTRNAPGSGEMMVNMMRNRSEEEKARLIRRHETPTAWKSDLHRLREAGVRESDLVHPENTLFRPFHLCDPATITLESETAEEWVLSACPVARLSEMYDRVTLRIGKEDGILRERQCRGLGGTGENVQRFSDVVLNPELPDDLGQFLPPDGVEVRDNTDDELRRLTATPEKPGRNGGPSRIK